MLKCPKYNIYINIMENRIFAVWGADRKDAVLHNIIIIL